MTILWQANLETPLNIILEIVYESCSDHNINKEEIEEHETTFLDVLFNRAQRNFQTRKMEKKHS